MALHINVYIWFLLCIIKYFLVLFFYAKNVLTVSGPANPENAKNIQRYIKKRSPP